jgi:WD40 repeat protein
MSSPASFLPSLDKPDSTHAASVLALRVSLNYVVSASRDYLVRVWCKSNGDLALPPLRGSPEATVKSVEIVEELGLVFGGDTKGIIFAWQLSDGEGIIVQPAHDDVVLSLVVDGRSLVSTSRDQCAKVWALEGIENAQLPRLLLQHTLRGHSMAVLAAKLSNHCIYTSSGDKSIRIWDKNSGKLLRTLEGVASMAQFQIRVDTAGTRQLVGACTDTKVRIYNIETGAELACLEGHINVVCSVQLLEPDQSDAGPLRIASASYDGTVRLWTLPQPTLTSWECVRTLSFSDAVVTPRPVLPQTPIQDTHDLVREEEARKGILARQGEKHINRALDMQVSGSYLYCCGEGAHIVAWRLTSTREC